MQLIDTQENKVFYEYMQSLASKQQKSIELKGSIEAATTESEKKLHEEKLRKLGEEVSNFQETFIQNNPDAFFSKVLLANKEIELPDAPTLADGRIDSSFQFRYYKNHFFEYLDFQMIGCLEPPSFILKLILTWKTLLLNILIQLLFHVII